MSLHDLRPPGLPGLPNFGSRLTNTLFGANPLDLLHPGDDIESDERDGSLRSRTARETGLSGNPGSVDGDNLTTLFGANEGGRASQDGWPGRSTFQGAESLSSLGFSNYQSFPGSVVAREVLGSLRQSLDATISQLVQLSRFGTNAPAQTPLGAALPGGLDNVAPGQQSSLALLAGSGLPLGDRALGGPAASMGPLLARDFSGLTPPPSTIPSTVPQSLASNFAAPTALQNTAGASAPSSPSNQTPVNAPGQTAPAQSSTLPLAQRADATLPSARVGEGAVAPVKADGVVPGTDRAANLLPPSLQTQANVAALAAMRGAEGLVAPALAQGAQQTPGITVGATTQAANTMANVPLARAGGEAPVQLPGSMLPAGHTAEGIQRRRGSTMGSLDRMASALQLLRLRRRNPYADQPFRQPDRRNTGVQWLMWIVVIAAYCMLAASIVMFTPADGHRDWTDFVTQSATASAMMFVPALIAMVGTTWLALRHWRKPRA